MAGPDEIIGIPVAAIERSAAAGYVSRITNGVEMDHLYSVPAGVQTRWASPENFDAAPGAATRGDDGRKRHAWFTLKRGESRVLAQAQETSGTIRRIWMTISDRSPKMLRGLKLEIFWDGANRPAIACPLGDFFNHPLARMATFESALFSSPEGRSFNCCIPMPFRTGMKVVLTNETDADQPMVFFDVNFTVGDRHDDTMMYLHAFWNRQNPTVLMQDFELLPKVQGRGRFLGVCIGVKADTKQWLTTWWGEGEVKMYLDGDTDLPALCGTGTEDYIGTGWGQGQYDHLYQGCHIADHAKMQYGFYRLHVPDPVYFHKDIRVTIQQIGCWNPETIARMYVAGQQLQLGEKPIDMKTVAEQNGHGIYERTDDWSSCAFFYLDKPTNELPALQAVAVRTAE